MNYNITEHKYPNYTKDNYVAYWFKLLYKLDTRLGILLNDSVGYNPMGLKDIASYLNVSTLTCKRFIHESVQLGIITKNLEKVKSHKRNVFRINVEYSLGILC